jgi:hypothetical protein
VIEMGRQSSVLARVAFGWMMLVAVLGGAFVIGETFDDPGGWAAAAIVASWLVPLVALALLALLRPAPARPVFIVGTLLVVTFTLADSALTLVPRDDWGPVASIVVFALGIALAFLGLSRASVAGTLLVVLAVAQLAAGLLDRAGSGEPPFALGGSSRVVVLPLLIGGLLFLLAGRGAAVPTPPTSPRDLAGTR